MASKELKARCAEIAARLQAISLELEETLEAQTNQTTKDALGDAIDTIDDARTTLESIFE